MPREKYQLWETNTMVEGWLVKDDKQPGSHVVGEPV